MSNYSSIIIYPSYLKCDFNDTIKYLPFNEASSTHSMQLFNDDTFVKFVIYRELYNLGEITEIHLSINSNMFSSNINIDASLIIPELTDDTLIYTTQEYIQSYNKYKLIASVNFNLSKNINIARTDLDTFKRHIKFYKYKIDKHDHTKLFSIPEYSKSVFFLNKDKHENFINNIIDCVQSNLSYNYLFYEDDIKIDQFIQCGTTNLNNDTFCYNISNGTMSGLMFNTKLNNYWVSSCIHVEFSKSKKTYHMYPIKECNALYSGYKINMEILNDTTIETMSKFLNDYQINDHDIQLNNIINNPDSNCNMSMPKIANILTIENYGSYIKGNKQYLKKCSRKKRKIKY